MFQTPLELLQAALMAKAADKLNRAAQWRFINVPGAG
jgi:hypothetical protein